MTDYDCLKNFSVSTADLSALLKSTEPKPAEPEEEKEKEEEEKKAKNKNKKKETTKTASKKSASGPRTPRAVSVAEAVAAAAAVAVGEAPTPKQRRRDRSASPDGKKPRARSRSAVRKKEEWNPPFDAQGYRLCMAGFGCVNRVEKQEARSIKFCADCLGYRCCKRKGCLNPVRSRYDTRCAECIEGRKSVDGLGYQALDLRGPGMLVIRYGQIALKPDMTGLPKGEYGDRETVALSNKLHKFLKDSKEAAAAASSGK